MDIQELKDKLATAQADYDSNTTALELVIDSLKRQKKTEDDPAFSGSVAVLRRLAEDTKKVIDRLTGQIETAERVEKTKTIVEPLIEAFGTVPVNDAVEFRIEFVDMEATFNKLTGQADALLSRLTAIRALQAAMETVGITPEVAAELKAVRFEPASPKTYKLAIARSSGTRASGGSRASSSKTIHTIVEAGEGYESLVGVKIGKGQDHETWRALVKAVNPTLFDELELKRKGEHPDSPGKFSNWSGALIAERAFGVKATASEDEPAE